MKLRHIQVCALRCPLHVPARVLHGALCPADAAANIKALTGAVRMHVKDSVGDLAIFSCALSPGERHHGPSPAMMSFPESAGARIL
jgi:hypothetical protein